MQDLIIKNAMLYDGTGAAPRLEQVAVKDGMITAVGADCGPAREVIDADGLALMPGIIDSHTHYDAQITWDPLASPSPSLGVTTVVMGNCGFTIAPCRPEDRDRNLRNLTHVEGMSLDALRAGVDWQFETFPEFLNLLEDKGVGPNVAAFIGHSSVRTWVLGEDASKRAATPAEVEKMRCIVLDGLQAGAVGFSTTTSYQHNGENGIPMPSRLADQHEMETLVGTLNEAKRGVFMLTKASDTKMSFLESLGQAAKRPMLVAAILHNPLVPEEAFEDMKGIATARTRGSDMYGAVSCCPLRFEFTMHEPYVFEALPSWAPAMKVHGEGAKALFASTEFRQGVKNELAKVQRRMFTGDWGKVHVAMVANDVHKALEGKSIEELAAADKKHPLDWMLDLALAEDLNTVFTAVLLNCDEAEVARLLTDPNALVSLSDAGAHLTFLCDAAFGLHFMGHWSRDKRLMPLERAVEKLTSDQARFFGIKNRGVVKVGAHADMLLFDPASVGRGEAKRLFDLPAGGSRLTTAAKGLHGVWVNGTQIADGSGFRKDAGRPGELLRSFIIRCRPRGDRAVELTAVIDLVWDNAQRGIYYPAALHGKLSLDDAYRVNLAITQRRLAQGEKQAGWKVGVTAKAMQEQMGVHQPVFGVLFESGHRESGVSLNFADLIEPSVENELCITIGKTLRGPGVTIGETRSAIALVAPALEIVERRGVFSDLPLAMADNAQQKHFVTAKALAWEPVSMRLSEASVDVYLNGVWQEQASGAEVMGDPVASVTWLANKLAEFDLALQAGVRVMSGSFTKQYRIKRSDHIESRFTPFGTVAANFP